MPEMPHDELRNAVRAICTRLQSDFEAELARLEARQREQVETAREEARRDAAATAAEELAARLEAERSEWQGRLQAQVTEASAEAERRLASEIDRVRAEAEQAAGQSATQLRQEMEGAAAQSLAQLRDETERTLAAERDRAAAEIEAQRARHETERAAERDRLSAQMEAERSIADALTTELDAARKTLTDLESVRATLTSELEESRRALASLEDTRRSLNELSTAHALLSEERDAARAALADFDKAPGADAVTVARAQERQGQLAFVERLLSAVRTVSAARSLSDTLTALTTAAASLAPRAAVFVVKGREAHGWRAAGFPDPSPATLRLPNDDGGLMAAATTSGATVSTAHAPAPRFATLAPDRAALAVPITVGGQSVAVLYADDGVPGESEAPASWPEAMQILGAQASTSLSHITAVRTAQAMRGGLTGAPGRPQRDRPAGEDDTSAKRYARLLVSEIKLYNEPAVRLGREKRDLLQRLRPEIERARRLYEERVSPSISSRAAYFQEELIHTLADGDSALLGSA